MKAINFFVTALIATLVLNCYPAIYAESLDLTEMKVILSSRVVGKYPQISGMDTLNSDIKKFMTTSLVELANHGDIFQRAGAGEIFDYTIEYNGDYAKLHVSINKPLGIVLKATGEMDYYIDTTTKTITTEEIYNTIPEEESEEELEEEPISDEPIELSSIYYYRLRDIAEHLGCELEFHPAEDQVPSGADILYIYQDGDASYAVVIASVFSGSSLILCDDVYFDMEYPVVHLDNYIYIPSTLVEWLAEIMYSADSVFAGE